MCLCNAQTNRHAVTAACCATHASHSASPMCRRECAWQCACSLADQVLPPLLLQVTPVLCCAATGAPSS
jgi:hypothetical protein